MPRGVYDEQRGDRKIKVGKDLEIVVRFSLRAVQILQARLGAERMEQVLGNQVNVVADMDALDALLEAAMHYHHGPRSEHQIDVLAEANGEDIERIVQGITESIGACFKKTAPAAGESGKAGPTNPASTSTS